MFLSKRNKTKKISILKKVTTAVTAAAGFEFFVTGDLSSLILRKILHTKIENRWYYREMFDKHADGLMQTVFKSKNYFKRYLMLKLVKIVPLKKFYRSKNYTWKLNHF